MKKHEWKVTECAPKLYPIEIVTGKLISTFDKVTTSIPSGSTINTGWGAFGSLWITGEKLKSVPDKLEVTWLSFAEKTFYTGKFDLPKQKIMNLFEKGTIDERGRKEPFDTFKIGLAPKGHVAIWLSGVGESVEIGYFQASKTEISMKEFHPGGVPTLEEYLTLNAESFSEELKEIVTNEVNDSVKERYSNYREKYLWKPKLTLNNSGTFENIYINYYNGEHLYTNATNPILQNFELRAVPKYISPAWSDTNNYKYKADIYTDEKEVLNAFSTLSKDSRSTECLLCIEVDKYNNRLKVYLKTDSNKIELLESEIKVYPND
ncbi:DUF2931 family protein [Zobellia nedashkovskayae]